MKKYKIAVLDDYQNVALESADWSVLRKRADIAAFQDHLADPDAVIERLLPFDVVCVMRERTPLPRNVIERLPNLKLIVSTGPGNSSIDIEAAGHHGITVVHTGYSSDPAIEFTWALIQYKMSRSIVERIAIVSSLRGITLMISMMLISAQLLAQPRRKEHVVEYPTFYRTVQVDGLSIFYREAGPKSGPTILLLHGLPSSSRMFEPLFKRLSDRYHLVAPDYPGFGHSDWPDPKKFAYTFDHYAEIMNRFTEALGLSHYTLYMQDYGGPVGFRLALVHPERIDALIVQDAVAHNEGLGANWKPRRAFWADRAANEGALRTNLLSLQTTRTRHVGNDPNVAAYDPDLWTDEFAFLSQPGQGDIQSDLFYDYRTNVDACPKWQAWMREKQPRLLVIWGKYDLSFDLGEPERYRKDVPKAEVHVLDAGHFALDTAADEIAALVRGFVPATR